MIKISFSMMSVNKDVQDLIQAIRILDEEKIIQEFVIKIKSIEQTLLPLVKQISTLVQHRSERPHSIGVSSERTMRAIGRVGQAVNLAVERFVTVGETIADDNPEIKGDMYEACKEARGAGSSIERLCEITATDPLGYPPPDGPLADRSAMIRAARSLLGSVTRVLLLADIVVVKQLLLAKDKVAKSLGRLESVANFTEFVKAFSVFGAEMVELAHVTGDRQNDLKDERRRAQMAAARQVLERSTMMLLTSSKACIRHADCSSARENRDTVFCQMRRAMDLIHYVVKDGVLEAGSCERLSPRGQIIADWDAERATAYASLRNFTRLIELYRPKYDNQQYHHHERHRHHHSSYSQSMGSAPTGAGVPPPSSSTPISSMNANTISPKVLTVANIKDISNGNDNQTNNRLRCDDRRSLDCEREFIASRRELIRSNSERDRHINNHHHHSQSHHSQQQHIHQQTKGRSYLSLDREINCCSSGGGVGSGSNSCGNSGPGCRLEPINHEISILNTESREHLMVALDKVIEKTQDFTDSAYTSHENRENILLLCDRCKLELNQCLRIALSIEQYSNSSYDLDSAIDNVVTAVHDLSQQLAISVADQTPELHHVIKLGIDIVNTFPGISINQELDRLQECADRFHDYIDHILEVCKLLRHIAFTETLQIQAKFTEINLRIYGPQVITAARVLAAYPSSKIAKENLEVFLDMWQWLASDVTSVSKEIIEIAQNQAKPDRLEYLSLPRPGKHGTTAKPLKPARLDQEEQEKIAKTGLEMKMLTNEMDAETDKWNGESDENNDIVKRAKNMSAMAFSMYQFTKGEGSLRTTQDLFTQAEYFAEEANRLYKVVRQFSYQVPAGQNKKELLDHLDKVPTYVQTLQFTVKEPTVGKPATFVKVDHVIRETKDLMNVINKVVTTCFECANKYKLDFSGLSGRAASGSARDDDSGPGGMGDSKGSTTSNEGSM